MMNPRHSNRMTLAALVLTTLAGSAFAQTQNQPKKSDEPALKGPTVNEGGVPGENRQFADGKVKAKDRMGGEIPHPLYMKALESLRAESAGDLRLRDAQEAQLKTINEEFTTAVSKYRDAHRDEVKELIKDLPAEDRKRAMEMFGREGRGQELRRPQLDKGKGKGAKAPEAAPSSDAMDDKPADKPSENVDAKKAEAARAKLRELVEGRPQPVEVHAKMFAVLSADQKIAFQKEVDRLKKELEDQRGNLKKGKKLEKKNLQQGSAAPATTPTLTPGDLNDPRLPGKIREKLAAMTPEQRQDAMQRFRERRLGKGPGDAKAAPSTTDDVKVPSPDDK